jgi:hypothetical protein
MYECLSLVCVTVESLVLCWCYHFDGCGLFQYSQERILGQDGKEESCSSGARRVSIFEVI